MNYILITSIDWADEFDVPFGEIIDELTYKKYQYLNEKFGSFYSYLSFGTNEGWDDGFDFLGFNFEPITEEETAVIEKFGLPNGEKIVEPLFDQLNDIIVRNVFPEDLVLKNNGYGSYKDLKTSLEEADLDTFKYYIDKYADFIKENEDEDDDFE